jgi:glycine C-acetyltransferase
MTETLDRQLGSELDALREARTYKRFLTIESAQGPVVRMEGRGDVIVLSSNNYLGLAGHPEVVRAGIEGLERYGAGTASVRFICGTFEPHLELERALADLSGTEAALTYVSCWNANEAVIPSLTDASTVILTDELNHASLIDAIRLSRPASKVIYPHSDMDALRDGLASAPRAARKLIVTDGVFSMEGDLAKLPEIVELAREHELVLYDPQGPDVHLPGDPVDSEPVPPMTLVDTLKFVPIGLAAAGVFWLGWRIDVPVLDWLLMIVGGFFFTVVVFMLWIFTFPPKDQAR